MRKAVVWAAAITGMTVAGLLIAQALADMRAGMRRGLMRAETVTNRTREALAETEAALRDARQTI